MGGAQVGVEDPSDPGIEQVKSKLAVDVIAGSDR